MKNMNESAGAHVTPPASCPDPVLGELATQYAAGTLPSREVAAFEEHLLLCASCQSTVELGLAMRAPGRPAARRTRRWAVAAGGVLAAAALVLLFVSVGDDSRALRALGQPDEAPRFEGLAVRAPAPDAGASQRFRDAMSDYAAGRYTDAATQLEGLAAMNPAPPVSFFLGASRLLAGNPEGALPPFSEVIARGRSAYRQEAFYYRGLAHLQLGRPDQAIADLRAAEEPAGPIATRAHERRLQVEGLRRR